MVSYAKNKVHIYAWRETHKEQYNEYKRNYDDKQYQAQYRAYKKECKRLFAIEII